jgi:ribosome-binding ATPase YchF (GTP1/OBG family)
MSAPHHLSFIENYPATLHGEISAYPFTTKAPNEGTAYVFDVCINT